MVKHERFEDQVPEKPLVLNSMLSAISTTNNDEEGRSRLLKNEVDVKQTIQPVKSSNEILTELFSVFNATPPVQLLCDSNLIKKVSKKVKKDKKKRSREKSIKSEDVFTDLEKNKKVKCLKKKSKSDREKYVEKSAKQCKSDYSKKNMVETEVDVRNQCIARKSTKHSTSEPDKLSSKKRCRSSYQQSDISLSDEETDISSVDQPQLKRTCYVGSRDRGTDLNVNLKSHHHESEFRNRYKRPHSNFENPSIDKKSLLEVARKNAISMLKQGNVPGLPQKVVLKMQCGGRSIQELTEFCKNISRNEISTPNSEEQSDKVENNSVTVLNHPFQIKEREPIIMNFKNAGPTFPSELKEDSAKVVTMRFPVSSGQVHRLSETVDPVESNVDTVKQGLNSMPSSPTNIFYKSAQKHQEPIFPIANSSGTYPLLSSAQDTLNLQLNRFSGIDATDVAERKKKTGPVSSNDSIFPSSPPDINVSRIITQRLNAIRRLQDNPTDSEALKMMYDAQRDMTAWAASKNLPGQFTGTTGAHCMKIHELNSGPQVWARRDQLTSSKPVTGGMGMTLLKKMGWKPGEGLGRSKTGSLHPLLLDVKLDKRGLVTREDTNQLTARSQNVGQRKTKSNSCVPSVVATSDKHPVCILNELTSKNKWSPPQYTLQHDSGPSHNRMFLFSVEINGQTYIPNQSSSNKKEAKMNAAMLCLRSMGLLPS